MSKLEDGTYEVMTLRVAEDPCHGFSFAFLLEEWRKDGSLSGVRYVAQPVDLVSREPHYSRSTDLEPTFRMDRDEVQALVDRLAELGFVARKTIAEKILQELIDQRLAASEG